MKKVIPYILNLAAGLGMAAVLLAGRGFLETGDTARKLCILSDALAVPGTVFLAAGILMLAAREGIFLGIGYAAGWAVRMLLPGGSGRRPQSYGDYAAKKKARPRKNGRVFLWTGFMLLLPAAGLAAACCKLA